MQLDDFKQAWTAYGAAMERSIAINERLLREVLIDHVGDALAPLRMWRLMELGFWLAGVLIAWAALSAHASEPRYLVAGGALLAYLVGMAALTAHQLVLTRQIDYGGPVPAIQRSIERIKLAEYRATKWAVLGGVVIWLPATLVLIESLTRIPALARVPLGWLIANLAFGVAVLALGQAWSKRHVERPDLGPFARRVVDVLASRSLRAASRHLAELARFERDDRDDRDDRDGAPHR